MPDYIGHPITIRTIPGVATIAQSGNQAIVNDRPASMIPASAILDNPQHYLRGVLRTVMPRLTSGEIAAVVLAPINGKDAQILITAEQYAAGAPERARYAAWLSGIVADRDAQQANERTYDLANNEGGEGYNPYRAGSERTYARTRNVDRDYPEGA